MGYPKDLKKVTHWVTPNMELLYIKKNSKEMLDYCFMVIGTIKNCRNGAPEKI